MNMARKEGPGRYQIGIYHVFKDGDRWRATTRDPAFRLSFATLAQAHQQLTGEPIRAPRQDRRQRAKSRAWARAAH